jgi:hypothetical protein
LGNAHGVDAACLMLIIRSAAFEKVLPKKRSPKGRYLSAFLRPRISQHQQKVFKVYRLYDRTDWLYPIDME